MNADLKIVKSIMIRAAPSDVWDTLINPEKISRYFTGAQTITNWQIGTEIVFIHQYEQQEFRNKGVILTFEKDYLLRYTYWTLFSKTEDEPENYTTITYTLTPIDVETKLSLIQTNFKNEKWYESLEVGWNIVLTKIKEISEHHSKQF